MIYFSSYKYTFFVVYKVVIYALHEINWTQPKLGGVVKDILILAIKSTI